MKILGLHILGATLLLSSLPVKALSPIAKKRTYECFSDQVVSGRSKSYDNSIYEYSATVTNFDGNTAILIAKKNYILGGQIRVKDLTHEIAVVTHENKYLTVQGVEWALAIAPQKKRASLYSANPDVNEVPMFCLSQ